MIFDFLVEENHFITLREHTDLKCYKIPEHRRAYVWECVEELNEHFHKHDVAISYIRNPYIDFLNFDTSYFPNVHVSEVPHTKTGKPAKYSHRMSFAMPQEDRRHVPETDTFGEIYFYPSGRIGKARVVFWRAPRRFIVEFRSTKNEELYMWRVYTYRKTDDKKIIVFENTPNL